MCDFLDYLRPVVDAIVVCMDMIINAQQYGMTGSLNVCHFVKDFVSLLLLLCSEM